MILPCYKLTSHHMLHCFALHSLNYYIALHSINYLTLQYITLDYTLYFYLECNF